MIGAVRFRRFAVRFLVLWAVLLGGRLLHPSGGSIFFACSLMLGSFLAAFAGSLVGRDEQVDAPPGQCAVLLSSAGPRVLDVVEELRASCGLTYATARRVCDEAPVTVHCAATPEEARAIAERLRRAGAEAT